MTKQEEILKNNLIKLGYQPNIFTPENYVKKLNNYCYLHIDLETDEEYKKARGLIHKAYVESNFIIHEQRIIDEIQKGFDTLQKELESLRE